MPGTTHRTCTDLDRAPKFPFLLVIFLALTVYLTGCQTPYSPTADTLQVTILADHSQIHLRVARGTRAAQALASARIHLGELDRTDPELTTEILPNDTIRVIRVLESFTIKQAPIPFEQQTVDSEVLAEGETRVIQHGTDGILETTYKVTTEDGIERNRQVHQSEVILQPVAEIVIKGTRRPFSSLEIPGKIAYLAEGRAWVMEGSTAQRRILAVEGNLDGKVFSISPDGAWLLFSLSADAETDNPSLNSVWVISLDDPSAKPIDLKVTDVAVYAGWVPGKSLTVAYSTVEPRTTAPGWQANNDLFWVSFTPAGKLSSPVRVLQTSAGGIYGWWGTNFAWSTDGAALVFARPDSIGLIDQKAKKLVPWIENEPFLSPSSQAWVPGLTWAPDGSRLFSVWRPVGSGEGDQTNQTYDLVEIDGQTGATTVIAPGLGMFANPAAAPHLVNGRLLIAALQARQPEATDSSLYRLLVIDPLDRSSILVFPVSGTGGLMPQSLNWSPQAVKDVGESIAFIYLSDIWIVPIDGGTARQITGDGTIERLDWK